MVSQRPRASVRRRGRSYQVRVYQGVDPLTDKESYLTESTQDEREVEKIKTRLLAQVDKQRSAATKATLAYALDEWIATHDGAGETITGYRSYIERTIKPALGDEPIAKINARTLERFYAELRRCRQRCDGQPFTEHATDEPHECGAVFKHYRVREHDCEKARCRRHNCKPHTCRPMADSTIRQIHWIIVGALTAAVRWDWIETNPATTAKKPRQPTPEPDPPTSAEAARIVNTAAEEDDQWGALVWLVMVTGIRRGELCALRWHHVDFEAGILNVYRARADAGEKDTKTHQRRRPALDEDTLALLSAHRARYEDAMRALRREPRPDAYVFSYDPAYTKPMNPDGVTHRYRRTCQSAGVDSHLHAMRHYSATELITAGVDIRTVAGRLGHGSGGTTTLRVYSAWVAESDRKAASIIAGTLRYPGRS